MAKLSTTLSLIDGFSNKLNAINSSLQRSGDSMGRFRSQVEKPVGSRMFDGFKAGLSSADSAVSSFSSSFAAKMGVISGITQAITTKAINVLSSGVREMVGELSSASATWQTFQGNMEMIGKSGDEIKQVKGELQDFATKTIYSASDMATTYSQLAAVGIDNTTALVKGFGGLAAAAENPAQAMKTLSQQATQAAAKPLIQWADFKLMLEQTPAGIAAIGRTMGMTTSELVKAVQEGKVKTEDFFNAIAETGTNEKFTEMATQFKTVGQAMDGLKEGLTNKLQPAFEILNKYGIKAVSAISDKIESMDFSKLEKWVDDFMPKLEKGIGKGIDWLVNAFQIAKTAVTDFISGFKDSGAIDAVVGAFNSIKDALTNISNAMPKDTTFFEQLGSLVGNGIEIVADIISKIANALSGMSPDQLKTLGIGLLAVAGGLKALKIAPNVISGLNGLMNIFGKGKSGGNAPSFDWIGSMKKSLATLVKGGVGIALVAGVAGDIMLLAKAMKSIDENVPSDFGSLVPKLLNMGIALTGMGAFVAIAGTLANKFKGEAIAGLLAVGGISLALMVAAEAMKQIDNKVPSNIGNMASKLANMGIALVGMGALMAIAGGLIVGTGGAGGVVLLAGLAAISVVALELIVVAEAIKQLDDKVPSNFGNIQGKLDTLAKVLEYMAKQNFSSMGDILSNAFGALNASAVATEINKLVEIARTLQDLNNLEIPTGVQSKVEQLKTLMNYISNSNMNSIMDSLNNAFGSLSASAVSSEINKLIEIANSLNKLNEIQVPIGAMIKVSLLKSMLSQFSQMNMNSIMDSINNFFGKLSAGSVTKEIDKLISIAQSLNKLNNIEIPTEAVDKTRRLKEILSKFSEANSNSVWDSFNNFFGKLNSGQVSSEIDKLIDIGNALNRLNGIEIPTGVIVKIAQLKGILQAFSNSNMNSIMDSLNNAFGNVSTGQVSAEIGKLIEIANQLNQLASIQLNTSGATTAINSIKQVLEQLKGLSGGSGDLGGISSGISGIATAIGQIESASNTAVTSLNGVVTAIQSFTTEVTTAGTQAGEGFTKGLETGLSGSIGVAQTTGANIVSAFANIPAQMFSIGVNIGQGLANGMNSMLGTVAAAASALAAQADKAARAAAQVHSPSRVFMETGEFFGQGLAIGMKNMFGAVKNAGTGLFDNAYSGNGEVPSKGVSDSGGTTNNNNSSRQTIIEVGGITIQSTGDPDYDAEKLLSKLEDLIFDADGAGLAY